MLLKSFLELMQHLLHSSAGIHRAWSTRTLRAAVATLEGTEKGATSDTAGAKSVKLNSSTFGQNCGSKLV